MRSGRSWLRMGGLPAFSGWSIGSLLLSALMIAPLATVFLVLFRPPGAAWGHLWRTVLAGYLWNTLWVITGTAVLTAIAGVGTAWLVSFYRFPLRRFLSWGLMLPLAIPTYIAAFAYAGLLDFAGPLQRLLRTWGKAGLAGKLDIMSLPGVVLVVSAVLFPYVYLITRAAFRSQSLGLVEAARMLGRSDHSIFWKVALPSARPAIAAGLGLVLLETLNEYGAMTYYGVDTFTTGIFRAWFSMGDSDAAQRLATLLMVSALAVVWLEQKGRGRVRYEQPQPNQLVGRELPAPSRYLATLFCLIPFTLGFLVPLSQLVLWTWQTLERGTIGAFLSVTWRTFLLALAAAGLTTFCALLLGYSIRLQRGSWLVGLSRLSVLGYSIPGVVIAIGVLIPVSQLDRLLSWLVSLWATTPPTLYLTGGLAALTYAYVVRFLAVAYQPTQAGFQQLCGHFDEAARGLGASPAATLFKIDLPLLGHTLGGAGLLVFVDVVKELPLTLILRPFNFDTLATRVFEYAGDERIAQAAPGALIIILTSLLPVLLLNRISLRAS